MTPRIVVEFETGRFNILWVSLTHVAGATSPTFSWSIMCEFGDLLRTIARNRGCWQGDTELVPIHYLVLRSTHPHYFGLGGDLNYFIDCIRRRDRDALYRYSRLALDLIYEWATMSVRGTTTIALVQGRMLGGAFELGLAADFLIAEEHSVFAFPEILFGLFPCSGGMSLLAQRVSIRQAQRMLADPCVYTVADLERLKLVDDICARGEGVRGVRKFIAAHAACHSARLMLQRARHRMAPLDYAEMLKVVDDWVTAAIGLNAESLRAMEMLIKLQRAAVNHAGISCR
ncbi:MAG: enoyl-CoA hydratase/isomerase family protein [Gammaproteobacteria bacterium]|nr:enoyl-CoA hydratase/isomerase family protein [Gammaproteobacteria bacterium]